jgi:hypothetical protein
MTEWSKTDWLKSEDVRPYVFMRQDLLPKNPGSRPIDWFPQAPLIHNPLLMGEVDFADQILKLEGKAFSKADMKMPRWVFYDCAVMPGFVCGFAYRTSKLSQEAKLQLEANPNLEWTPISLFIAIPSLKPGEWIAHNLCTMNSLISEPSQLYALGFLSKAFGLWFANVENLCGMTQWLSPAIRLHSNYGPFEIMTAYTPVHSYARTLTYRAQVTLDYWPAFFNKKQPTNHAGYVDSGIIVDPKDDLSLKKLQSHIENGEGPFYFKPSEIRLQPLDSPLKVYRLASHASKA